MFCIKCGKENRDNARYCTSCGTILIGTVIESKDEEKKHGVIIQDRDLKKQKWHRYIIITIIVLLLLMAIGVLVLWNVTGSGNWIYKNEVLTENDKWCGEKEIGKIRQYEEEVSEENIEENILITEDNIQTEPIDEDGKKKKWLFTKETFDYYEELIEKEEYDENGNVIAYYQYDSDCNLMHYVFSEYDDEQNLIKTEWYDAQGVLTSVINYYYQYENNFREVYYEENGELRLAFVEEYNEKQIKIAEYSYRDGTQTIDAKKEYDENGNLIAWYLDAGNGELCLYEAYEYDEQGRMVTYMWEFDENSLPLGCCKYEYDDYLVRGYGCDSSGTVMYMWENVYEKEFDEDGDVIAWYEYDEEGTCIAYEKYIYVTAE